MEPQNPEDRIAELERQLREARAAARRARSGVGEAAPFRNAVAQEHYSQTVPEGVALAAAPRRIPVRFLLAEILPFRWWYLFALFVVAIPPIIVWIMAPKLFLPAALVVLLVIYGIQFRAARTRTALLKWGKVATVTGAELVSRGTYFSGTTYSNVVLPFARGWTVTRPMWSGPKSKTRVRYQLDGYQGDIIVGGREYIDGVVLADQRRPQRALCVTSFPYDLDRDETGNWVGRLRVRLVVGMVCWLFVMIGWVGGAALLYPRSQAAVSPGGEVTSLVCDRNDVTVNGANERVDITGHCSTLTVLGSGNQVSVDVADTITANGINNVVTFRAGAPTINNIGISNVVRPG